MTPGDLDRLDRAIADHDAVAVMAAAPGLVAAIRLLIGQRNGYRNQRDEAKRQLLVCNQARDALARRADRFLDERNEAEALCLALGLLIENDCLGEAHRYVTQKMNEKLAAMRERQK